VIKLYYIVPEKGGVSIKKYFLCFFLILSVLIFTEDYFSTVKTFDVGTRVFHIDVYKNYAILADYDGTVSIIDYFNYDTFKYKSFTIPMGGVYDGTGFFIIDNYKKSIIKIVNNKTVKTLILEGKPTTINYFKNLIYVVTTSPDKIIILNSDLTVKNSYNLPVRSPFLRITNNNIYIPIFENYEDNILKTNTLFFMPEKNTFLINNSTIKNPINVVDINGSLYFLSYFDGKLYKNSLKTQSLVADFKGYSRTILSLGNYIIGHSMYGGVFYYDTKTGMTEKIIEDVPITDICLSPDNEYIYAISHINNKLYIIKDKKIYQIIELGKNPIDVESPDKNIILVLNTEEGTMEIIRRFE